MPCVNDLPTGKLHNLLSTGRFRLAVGPYVYSIRSPIGSVQDGLQALYGDFGVVSEPGFSDYHIGLHAPNVVQRLRKRIDFYFEETRPFNRIKLEHAYAFLEWGMNWCVSVVANENLKLHSAVVSKNGVAIIMPGLPGAGKSTLCAALALCGWRVLSDEHALIPPGTACAVPLPRPVSLKNESIDIIKSFDARAVFGPESIDTHKGRVAHMKADLTSDSHNGEPLPVRLLIFPKYKKGARSVLKHRSRVESFIAAANHSFNYSLLHTAGFDAMSTLLDAVECYSLDYDNLDHAVSTLDQLHEEVTGV